VAIKWKVRRWSTLDMLLKLSIMRSCEILRFRELRHVPSGGAGLHLGSTGRDRYSY